MGIDETTSAWDRDKNNDRAKDSPAATRHGKDKHGETTSFLNFGKGEGKGRKGEGKGK